MTEAFRDSTETGFPTDPVADAAEDIMPTAATELCTVAVIVVAAVGMTAAAPPPLVVCRYVANCSVVG